MGQYLQKNAVTFLDASITFYALKKNHITFLVLILTIQMLIEMCEQPSLVHSC